MDIWKKKGAVSPITKETRRESHAKTITQNMAIKVVEALEKAQEPLTAREVAQELYAFGVIPYPARAVIQPRLTELVEAGVIEVTGKKRDEETGRTVAVYEVVQHEL